MSHLDLPAALNGLSCILTNRAASAEQLCDDDMAAAPSSGTALGTRESHDLSNNSIDLDICHSSLEETHGRIDRDEPGFCTPGEHLPEAPQPGSRPAQGCLCAVTVGRKSAEQEGLRERESRLAAGFCAPQQEAAAGAAPQHHEEVHEQKRLSEADLDSHATSLKAQVGRLIAEAATLEDDNAELEAHLRETHSDNWYLRIAKTGLEDRVAHLAAALVQAEGLSEQLDLRCAEQEQSLKALHARLNTAEAELRRSAQLQRAQLVYLNMELELCRDRRARQALERIIEVFGDSSDALLAKSSAEGQNVLRASLLQRSCSSAGGMAAGCWPVGFGGKKGTSRSSSAGIRDPAASESAPALPNPASSSLAHSPCMEAMQASKASELLELAALRKTASFGPATPGRTEDSAREARGGMSATAPVAAPSALQGRTQLHPAAIHSNTGQDASILRADSAQEVPVKRRATGHSPSWSRGDQSTKVERSNDGPDHPGSRSSAFMSGAHPSSETPSSQSSGHDGISDGSWVSDDDAMEQNGRVCFRMSSHEALSMAATPSGRLAFAHSVMPMISNIGRQLAAQYAVVFENGRLRDAQPAGESDSEEPNQPLE